MSSGRMRPERVALIVALCLLLWEALVWIFRPSPVILPAPSRIFVELYGSLGYFVSEGLYTLWTTLAGFALATAAGLVLAIAIIYSRILEQTIFTLLVSLNSVPKVAIAPLFVIWLGTASAPKIAIAMLIALFPIVIDSVLGLRSIDPDMLDLARSLRGSQLKILWKIRFPAAMPSIFAGLKVGISLALVGAIVGEFVAAQHGLGYIILVAQGQFDTPRVFAAIFLLAFMGAILFSAVDLAEKVFLPWHVSRRRRG